jgi:predicted esterase
VTKLGGLLSSFVAAPVMLGCSGGADRAPPQATSPQEIVAVAEERGGENADPPETAPPPLEAPSPPSSATPEPPPSPGDPPSGDCQIAKGEFVERWTEQSSYVAYVPEAYDGEPTPLIVGLHGCGDDAANFAAWGVNPYATRETQTHIGISIDGASGGSNCWNLDVDAPKVLAAIEDIASCVYVHRRRVVLAGFSSGGELAYSLGLREADRFAGLLIENASLTATGAASELIAGAAWKVNVAHVAHVDDSVFPIDAVRADWALLTSHSFPLVTSEVAGDHDGTTEDWANWLIPQASSWQR